MRDYDGTDEVMLTLARLPRFLRHFGARGHELIFATGNCNSSCVTETASL